jgi:plastocyanin
MRALLALPLLALALAGCTGGTDDSGHVTPRQDEAGRYVIELTADNAVVPAKAKVPVGSTVVWTVAPGGFHDVTSADGSPMAFSSDTRFPSKMRGGDAFDVTFTQAGRYPYQCLVHAGMMPGEVLVTP